MQYVRHVDPSVFPLEEFRSHFIAEPANGLDTAYCIQTRVPPGKGTTRGVHVHPADQIYYILKGQMNVQLGDQEYVARPGQLVFMPRGLPHWNWNTTDEEEVHFELIVPAPAREDIALDPGTLPVPDVSKLQMVRTLDETKFDQARFSQVVIADRATGCENVSLGIFRTPPGGQSPALHVHRVDQVYFVMQGEMTLQIGFEEYKAGPNTLVILPAGMPHRNWNATSEPEYHINLRLPEPLPEWGPWDLPVTIENREAT
jgi:mannose-6-phosphate isomerase-like protein (cupin superfamily)